MKKIFLLCLVFAGCDSSIGNSSDSDNSTNIISGQSSAVFDCDRCRTDNEIQLASLGYNPEEFANCTDLCDLPANGDPEKIQCDRNCISDRVVAAQQACLVDKFCPILDPESEEQP